MMNKQPTAQEIEQAKTDPLYIFLILRQRMRNELQFAPGAHRMSIARDPSEYPFGVVNDNSNNHTFSDIHAHAPQVARSIPLFESELEILLKHFSSFAEKANDLAGLLAYVESLETKVRQAEEQEMRREVNRKRERARRERETPEQAAERRRKNRERARARRLTRSEK